MLGSDTTLRNRNGRKKTRKYRSRLALPPFSCSWKKYSIKWYFSNNSGFRQQNLVNQAQLVAQLSPKCWQKVLPQAYSAEGRDYALHWARTGGSSFWRGNSSRSCALFPIASVQVGRKNEVNISINKQQLQNENTRKVPITCYAFPVLKNHTILAEKIISHRSSNTRKSLLKRNCRRKSK